MSTIVKILTLLTIWFKCTISEVVPYDQDQMNFYGKDSIQINMTKLFDLSKASLDVKFTTDTGRIITNATKYSLTSLEQYSFSKVDFAHFINNQTYVAIFDNSQLLIRQTSMDGKDIISEIRHSFTITGVDITCTDIESNDDFSKFYLVCFRKSVVGTPGAFYVSEFESKTGNLIKTVAQDLTTQYEAIHTVRIMMTDINKTKGSKKALIVYDQGLSATNTTKNFWLAVLTGPEPGDSLFFVGFIDLRAAVTGITSFFDAFDYENGVVISGFVSSVPQIISGIDCDLNDSPLALICSKQPVPTLVKKGYVGFLNTGQMVMVDLSSSNPFMAVCDVVGDFEKETWKSCKTYLSIEQIDGGFVTEVIGNADVLMIKYDHPDGTYAGHTVIATTVNINPMLPAEWINTDATVQATVLDKRVHYVTAKMAWANWMTRPALELDTAQSAIGLKRLIKITAEEDGQKVISKLPIYVLSNFFEGVSYNSSNLAPVSVYEDSSFEIYLIQSAIEGNNLDFTVSFAGNDTSKFSTFVADTKNIGVLYKFKTGTPNFKDVTFFDNFAVSLDTKNNLVFYICTQTKSLVNCEEKGNRFVPSTYVLQKRMFKALNYAIAWTQDDAKTNIFMFDMSGICYTHELRSKAFDIVVTELELDAYLLASYPDQNKIENWAIPQYNPDYLDQLPDITQSTSGAEYFCPSKMYFCPNGANVLEVLSSCAADRRMLKYTYWPAMTQTKLRNFIPINLNLTNGQFCPMGGEFIISSIEKNTVFGVPTYWENAYYDFGISELALGQFVKVDCVPSLGMFSLVTKDVKGNLQLSIFIGNSQYSATSRLRTVETTGLEGITDVTNHYFLGNMIHVKNVDDGSIEYMMTYSMPKVYVKTLASDKSFDTTMFITASNPKSNVQIMVPVEIQKFDSSITVEVKSKVEVKQPGVYNIEDYLKINGIFTTVSVEGADKSEVEVLPRVQTYKQYEPDYFHTYKFKHIESSDNVQVALHSDNPNSAIFSLFTEIDKYEYSFSAFPGVGVKGFHFAVVDNTNDGLPSLLVAFCTEGLQEDRLDIFLVHNGSISAIGHQNYACSKTKVIKRDSGSHYYVVTHDGAESDLNVFNVTLKDQAISMKLLETWENVYTWGIAETKNAAYVIMIYQGNFYEPFVAAYERGTTAPSLAKRISQDLTFWRSKHLISAIECIALDDVQFSCVYDTYSTKIYEITASETDINSTIVNSYTKVPGFDGRYFVMTKSHFGVLASNHDHDFWDILIYKRRSAGGSGDLYSYVGINKFAPFTMIDLSNGTTAVSYSTNEAKTPLKFSAISTLKLDVKSLAVLDKKLSLKFGNLQAGKSLDVNALLINKPDDNKSLPVWPFVLVLFLLVLAGLAYLFYVNQKQEKEASMYSTLNIENKVSIGDKADN